MKIILFNFILFLRIYLFSQVNIEKFRQDQDSINISANISTGFSVRKGNTEYAIFDGEGLIIIKLIIIPSLYLTGIMVGLTAYYSQMQHIFI